MYALASSVRLPSCSLVIGAALRQPIGAVTVRASKPAANSICRLQCFTSESGTRVSTLRRVKTRRTLKEIIMAPAGDTGLYY